MFCFLFLVRLLWSCSSVFKNFLSVVVYTVLCERQKPVDSNVIVHYSVKTWQVAQMGRDNAQNQLRGECHFVYHCEPRPSQRSQTVCFLPQQFNTWIFMHCWLLAAVTGLKCIIVKLCFYFSANSDFVYFINLFQEHNTMLWQKFPTKKFERAIGLGLWLEIGLALGSELGLRLQLWLGLGIGSGLVFG